MTPVPMSNRRRGTRDVPDATDNRAEGKDTLEGEDGKSGMELETTAPLAKRQTSLSSSVDPPDYPKNKDVVDARPASDGEDESNESSYQENLTAEQGQVQSSSVLKQSTNTSHVDAHGNESSQTSNVDLGGGSWRRIRDVPVSPAPLYKDCLIMYATPPGKNTTEKSGIEKKLLHYLREEIFASFQGKPILGLI